MVRFYDFATRVTGSDRDIGLQVHRVEKIKNQLSKMTEYLHIHGGGIRDLSVDTKFYKLLETFVSILQHYFYLFGIDCPTLSSLYNRYNLVVFTIDILHFHSN